MVILPTNAVDFKSCLLNNYPLNHTLKNLTIISFIMIIDGLINLHGKNRETMANTAQAKKRARQAEKSRIRNAGQRSNLRTFVKKVIAAVRAGDKEKAKRPTILQFLLSILRSIKALFKIKLTQQAD
jgi:ribosomal protein S20